MVVIVREMSIQYVALLVSMPLVGEVLTHFTFPLASCSFQSYLMPCLCFLYIIWTMLSDFFCMYYVPLGDSINIFLYLLIEIVNSGLHLIWTPRSYKRGKICYGLKMKIMLVDIRLEL